MGVVGAAPHPPGDYDIVVVGTGPGGLQTSYFLGRLGVQHALLSADDAPGGMFRKWPVFERLLTWSKLEAPFPRESREYERYDHNSLVADEPFLRALVPNGMSGDSVLPTRAEMEAGHVAFAEQAGIEARYGCRWTGTRRDGERLVLETTDGEYACAAAVFAIGVTEPWRPPVPGIEAVPHYGEVTSAEPFRDKQVVLIGKRNSGFELASRLLPVARRVVLVSPRPVRAEILARATVRVPYFQPYEDRAHGGGTGIVDSVVERIELTGDDGYVVHTGAGPIAADVVIAATGFTTPFGDLESLGVDTVARNRIPALTPFWESVSAPGVFFAGNASQGAFGLRRHGAGSFSTAVLGFRYNARILARHLAERVGRPAPEHRALSPDDVVPHLTRELEHGPELWTQKGYLARAVTADGSGFRDEGVVPLEHFVDSHGPDGVAVSVEAVADGSIHPVVYTRRRGRVRDVTLDAAPLDAFDAEQYRRQLAELVGI